MCLLRTPKDANYIAENAKNRHVIIVGSSFIGMEAAAYLIDTAASVTIIGRSSAPFSNVFGKITFLFRNNEQESHRTSKNFFLLFFLQK